MDAQDFTDVIQVCTDGSSLSEKGVTTAVELAKTLAGVENARVVEYKKPFSLPGWLNSKAQLLPRLDRAALYELTTPQLMYIWGVEY